MNVFCVFLHVSGSLQGGNSVEKRVVFKGFSKAYGAGFDTCVCELVCLSVKAKVKVSKYTEHLYIRYSIPTARL